MWGKRKATPAGHVVPGNGTAITVIEYGADAWSEQAASLGIMTNTNSPASRGQEVGAGSLATGLTGFGLGNQHFGGATREPHQSFHGATAPIGNPSTPLLDPGYLPATGTRPDVPGALGWLDYGQALGL